MDRIDPQHQKHDPHTTQCDWCGQRDTDPIKPQDGQVTA